MRTPGAQPGERGDEQRVAARMAVGQQTRERRGEGRRQQPQRARAARPPSRPRRCRRTRRARSSPPSGRPTRPPRRTAAGAGQPSRTRRAGPPDRAQTPAGPRRTRGQTIRVAVSARRRRACAKAPPARDQLGVRAALGDASAVEHDDLVERLEAFDGVRDHEDAAGIAAVRPERRQQLARPARVEMRRRLVEDQEARVGEERPRERDPPALAAGDLGAVLADLRVQAGGEAGDPRLPARRASSAARTSASPASGRASSTFWRTVVVKRCASWLARRTAWRSASWPVRAHVEPAERRRRRRPDRGSARAAARASSSRRRCGRRRRRARPGATRRVTSSSAASSRPANRTDAPLTSRSPVGGSGSRVRRVGDRARAPR